MKNLIEFCKIIKQFIPDLLNTFPEYQHKLHEGIIEILQFNIPSLEEYEDIDSIEIENIENIQYIFDFCKEKLPSKFFDILYQNENLFQDDMPDALEFLPNINFKLLFNADISEKTKEVLWKYLQLLLFCVVGGSDDYSMFGETAKMFEAINQDEFREKMEETFSNMQHMFDDISSNNEGMDSGDDVSNSNTKMPFNIPDPKEMEDHIQNLMNGKIGALAKEIAEETAKDLDIDFENATDMKSVFGKLFKNPTKLMNIVKNIGSKLDSKMKSGDIKESELMEEATNMMKDMKNMPGMENIQEMLGQFGLPTGKKGKFNMGAFQQHMKKNMNINKMKEDMLNRMKQKQTQQNQTQVFRAGESPERSTREDREKIMQELLKEEEQQKIKSVQSTQKLNKKQKQKKKHNKNTKKT